MSQTDPQPTDINKDEESLLAEIAFKYVPYWPLFLLLLLASLAGAWLFLRYTPPVYKASADILIKDEDKGIYESQLTEALNPFGSSKIVENETIILKSKSLMKDVVRNLHLYSPVYHKGHIRSGSAYVSSPVRIEVKNPSILTERLDLSFSYDEQTTNVFFDNKEFALGQWFLMGTDSMRFIANNIRDESKVDYPLYFSLYRLGNIADVFSVNASPSDRYSTVINLTIEDEVPQRAADILNELIQVYNRASIDDKNKLAENTLEFVEDRLRYVVQELDSVEGALQKYKLGEDIVDISAQGQLFLQNVGEVDKQVSQIGVQLAVLDQVERYVVSNDNATAIVPSTFGVSDPALSHLLEKLYDLEIQYERLKKTTAENNPVIVSIRDQISRVKPSILGNIRSQRTNLVATRSNLLQTSSGFSSKLRGIPQKERGLIDISRQQGIKNNIYTFLLEKREETALSFGSTVADTRIIDPAETPKNPIKPNKKWIIIIALFIGLLISTSIVSLKEILNNKILYRSEIERLVTWPIVGEISYSDTKAAIVTGSGVKTVIAEQFRALRTSLSYLVAGKEKKKVLITSSISGEGKSFISMNLAVSLALTDKRVVLIELDLRKPKLSSILDLKKDEIGITNYLIGRAEIYDILKKPTGFSNLHFIPSGPLPPNPSELILNRRMETLLEILEQSYDYIIIDTAPVVPVTDGHILSKYCDLTLYIIRHGVTPKEHIRTLEATNKARGLKNVNIIFNGVKNRGFGGYSYGYGYADKNYIETTNKNIFHKLKN